MNVLLLRPRPHRETIGLQNVMICEPLELEYLAAALLEAGHRVEIVDLILDRRPLERITAQFQPRLVGITGYVAHVNVVKALAARVKALVPGVWWRWAASTPRWFPGTGRTPPSTSSSPPGAGAP